MVVVVEVDVGWGDCVGGAEVLDNETDTEIDAGRDVDVPWFGGGD